jgi:hypothetical protein
VQENEGTFRHEIRFTEEKSYSWDDFPVHARPVVKKKKRQKKGAAAGEEVGAFDTNEPGAAAATAGGAGAGSGAAAGAGAAATSAAAGADGGGAASAAAASEDNQSPIMYLRVDPDHQWILKYTFYQPEEMWLNQLGAERNIDSEGEVVKALKAFRTGSSIDCLAEILSDPDRYVGVRVEAAKSLGVLAGADTDWKSGHKLVSYYRETHYERTVLETNDFSDFSRYYVARAVLEALSKIKDEATGHSFDPAVELITDVLRNNDNSLNVYSDYAFLGTLVRAAGRLSVSNINPLYRALADQLERYVRLAELVPCHGEALRQAVIATRMLGTKVGNKAGERQYYKHVMENAGFPSSLRAEAANSLFSSMLKGTFDGMPAKGYAPVMNDILNVVEDSGEYIALRIKILEHLAKTIREHHLAMQFLPDPPPRLFSEPENFTDSETKRHTETNSRLWKLCSGKRFAFCEQLRQAATSLYQAIWGLGWPACIPVPPDAIKLASKVDQTKSKMLTTSTQSKPTELPNFRDAIGGLTSSSTSAMHVAGVQPVKEEKVAEEVATPSEPKKLKLVLPPVVPAPATPAVVAASPAEVVQVAPGGEEEPILKKIKVEGEQEKNVQ